MYNSVNTVKGKPMLLKITLLSATLVVYGCANTSWLEQPGQSMYGPRIPCVVCGEKWSQFPNELFEAQTIKKLR